MTPTQAFQGQFRQTEGLAVVGEAVRRVPPQSGIRNQFHHMIDIVPTILEATGITPPDVVDGIPQKPIEGVSMMYTFDAKNANEPSQHHTQYFEMMAVLVDTRDYIPLTIIEIGPVWAQRRSVE